MDRAEFDALVAATNADLVDPKRNRDIDWSDGSGAAGLPRFEVYHAAPSLCSHKVRMTLGEQGLPWRSHDMQIMPRPGTRPENYAPAFVRLRLAGAPTGTLVDEYTGRSSVDTEGYDPAVVPLLVDHEAGEVVGDSSRICDYLVRNAGTGPDLRPADLSDEIDELIAIVDRAPHVALLYGANPDGDHRPDGIQKNMPGVHARKVAAVEGAMAEAGDDEALQAAYRAKIAKEQSAGRFVAKPDSMGTIVGQMKEGVDALEARMAKHGGQWTAGDRFTLADIVWAASLFRMRWIGVGGIFDAESECPRVFDLAERLFARPTFRAAIFEWPTSYGPSPHVPEMATPEWAENFLPQLVRE